MNLLSISIFTKKKAVKSRTHSCPRIQRSLMTVLEQQTLYHINVCTLIALDYEEI